MLVAALKEKNYEAARGILEAFCREYGWHEEVDSKTRSIDLNVRSFPQSVARMMTFTLFSRLPEEVVPVNLVVGKNAKAVKRLLEEDLFPRVEYRQVRDVLRVNATSLRQWVKRRELYPIRFELVVCWHGVEQTRH